MENKMILNKTEKETTPTTQTPDKTTSTERPNRRRSRRRLPAW